MKIGDKVTCKYSIDAYYSGYGGLPKQSFEPGMIGTVGAINVPSVRREQVTFTCVDFVAQGIEWRCALLKDNIKLVNETHPRT